MPRAVWNTRIGFIFAAIGSAIGLANIIRFPYLVSSFGGGTFIIIYLFCLVLIGLPVFLAELSVGKYCQQNTVNAFKHLGKHQFWRFAGIFVLTTALIISCFYSALSGWILGYLVNCVAQEVIQPSLYVAEQTFQKFITNPIWTVKYHLIFMLFCLIILKYEVAKGLERISKILLPLMFLLLVFLLTFALQQPGAYVGIKRLLFTKPDLFNPTIWIMALGQACFTLSIGQGTMITYGSYLQPSDSIIKLSIPIVIVDTFVSIVAALIVYAFMFSLDVIPQQGIGLMFKTLPVVFASMPNGELLAVLFFLLVFIAALTSQLSVLEPMICYLIDNRNYKRSQAVYYSCAIAACFGIPLALSFSSLSQFKFLNLHLLELVDGFATCLLLPCGAMLVLVLINRHWGIMNFLHYIQIKNQLVTLHLKLSLKYISPWLLFIIAMYSTWEVVS